MNAISAAQVALTKYTGTLWFRTGGGTQTCSSTAAGSLLFLLCLPFRKDPGRLCGLLNARIFERASAAEETGFKCLPQVPYF